MTPLKCPNPGCPFLFDPSQVPPGAVIACPRCGLRFTLPPTLPAAKPPPAAPEPPSELAFMGGATAARKPKVKPDADGRSAPGRDDEDEDDALPPKSISLKAIVLVCVGFLLLGGIVSTYLVIRANRKKVEQSGEIVLAEYGLTMKRLDASTGWERNDAIMHAFDGKLFGYSRVGAPDGWIAADAKKYPYVVRPTDLKERMHEQVGRNFSEVPPQLDGQPTTYLGLPATKYSFRGLHKETGTPVLGEVTTLATGTVAVWLYAYAAERDFEGLGEAFQVARASLRKAPKAGGEAAPRFEKSYRDKEGYFVITDTEGVWAKDNDPQSQEPDAKLWLRGTAKSLGRRDGPAADLVVAVLDAGADPEKHVIAQLNTGHKIEAVSGDPTGDPPASGELSLATEVTRLKVRYPGSDAGAFKLVAYSSVQSGGKTVVAYAICPLKDLEYWEQRAMQIVGSLKATK